MKKIFYSILIMLFLFIPFMVKAEGKVEIKEVKLLEKSDSVVVVDPEVNGISINFDVKFKEINTFAKYEVSVVNNSNEEYDLVVNDEGLSSEYIKYQFNVDGEKTIKKGEEKKITVTITYISEVPEEQLDDAGMFQEKKDNGFEIVADAIRVPDTLKIASIVSLIIVGALIIAGFVLILKNNNKGAALLIVGIITIPFIVSAANEIKLVINTNVKVTNGISRYCVVSLEDYMFSYHEFEDNATLLSITNATQTDQPSYTFEFTNKDELECFAKGDFSVCESKRTKDKNRLTYESCMEAADSDSNPDNARKLCQIELFNSNSEEMIKDASYGCYSIEYLTNVQNNETSNTYLVKFNGNGSTGGETVSKYCTYGEGCELSTNNFSKKGYRFSGWADTPYGVVKHNDGASINMNSSVGEEYNLYAVWTPITYPIIYNPNGGTGSMNYTTCTYDQVCILRTNTFVNGTQTFKGWSRNPNGGGTIYPNNAGVQNLVYNNGEPVYLYAVWQTTSGSDESYTYIPCVNPSTCPTGCSAYSDGGCSSYSGATGNYTCRCPAGTPIPKTYRIAYNFTSTSPHPTSWTRPSGLPDTYTTGTPVTINQVPVSSEYVFNGWSRTSSGVGATYSLTVGSASDNSDIVVYANWCKKCVMSEGIINCNLNTNNPGKCNYNVVCQEGYDLVHNGNQQPICQRNGAACTIMSCVKPSQCTGQNCYAVSDGGCSQYVGATGTFDCFCNCN